MSVLIDVILTLILAVCAIIGYKHGLVRALSKFVSYLVAFTLANKLYDLLAAWIARMPLFAEMISGEPFTERMTFLDRSSEALNAIKENAVLIGAPAEQTERIVDEAVAVLISSAIAFAVLFAAFMLLMKLVLFILDGSLSKIPVLKQINGILGGVFGLLNGFFWTWMVTSAFVRFLLPTLTEKWPTLFVSEISESVIVQFCTKVNPITYLVWLINFIFH